jgi:hypothetical protein
MVDAPSTVEQIRSTYAKARRSDGKRACRPGAAPRLKSRPTESPLAGSVEKSQNSTKKELALWRAFLGDEIDATLRDKD